MATPFVQGRLRHEHLMVTVNSQCAHSGEALEIQIDSGLNYQVLKGGDKPIVFVPDVDLFKLKDDNIIEAF